MWTKICANTNVDDALLAVEMGADAVGFVFAPSKRQVTPDEAAEIIAELPSGVEKVGVFVTDDPNQVQGSVDVAGLTAVQLHGAYRASMVQHLVEECGEDLKIIQTMAYELDSVDREDVDARFEGALRLRPSVRWAEARRTVTSSRFSPSPSSSRYRASSHRVTDPAKRSTTNRNIGAGST